MFDASNLSSNSTKKQPRTKFSGWNLEQFLILFGLEITGIEKIWAIKLNIEAQISNITFDTEAVKLY